jgi:hypothetical protein
VVAQDVAFVRAHLAVSYRFAARGFVSQVGSLRTLTGRSISFLVLMVAAASPPLRCSPVSLLLARLPRRRFVSLAAGRLAGQTQYNLGGGVSGLDGDEVGTKIYAEEPRRLSCEGRRESRPIS